jgi:selenide,water dikinase
MTSGSEVEATLWAGKVPTLPAAWNFASAGQVPGGTQNNLDHVADLVTFEEGVSQISRLILADAQTSGGLLISLPESKADDLLTRLHKRGVAEAAVIGIITDSGRGNISVEV